MKEKLLSTISLITIFVPFTVILLWNANNPNATAILTGYCIFSTISFFYTLFLFAGIRLRNTNVKISLGVNSLYFLCILAFVVFPRLMN
jgi:hypothetical protein